MPSDVRKPPLYQRYRDSGAQSHNLAGVEAALKAGDDPAGDAVTWLVRADTLGGLVPKAGTDYLRDVHGDWWQVSEVGPLTDGSYPLRCDRWQKGGDE
jgi:hypothetical protein